MSKTAEIPEALVAEYDLRAKRACAVAAVRTSLQAARTEAEGQSVAAATVAAALRAQLVQLRDLRDRLEAERDQALAPAPGLIAAEDALALAIERSRSVSVANEPEATVAVQAQADAEDRLAAAKQEAQGRNLRPLELRLHLTIQQASDMQREVDAAETAQSAADKAQRKACIDLLRLRRDEAALALDEATVDLAVAGGAHHMEARLTLGESNDLMRELGQATDFYFGSSPHWRAQKVGRFDPAFLLDHAEPIASRSVREAGKLLAA